MMGWGVVCFTKWGGLPCIRRKKRQITGRENAALFIRLGPPSALIRHENVAFRKHSSNRRNLNTPAFRLRVDRKRFENDDLVIIT